VPQTALHQTLCNTYEPVSRAVTSKAGCSGSSAPQVHGGVNMQRRATGCTADLNGAAAAHYMLALRAEASTVPSAVPRITLTIAITCVGVPSGDQ
jgi:hypothetical protein